MLGTVWLASSTLVSLCLTQPHTKTGPGTLVLSLSTESLGLYDHLFWI